MLNKDHFEESDWWMRGTCSPRQLAQLFLLLFAAFSLVLCARVSLYDERNILIENVAFVVCAIFSRLKLKPVGVGSRMSIRCAPRTRPHLHLRCYVHFDSIFEMIEFKNLARQIFLFLQSNRFFYSTKNSSTDCELCAQRSSSLWSCLCANFNEISRICSEILLKSFQEAFRCDLSWTQKLFCSVRVVSNERLFDSSNFSDLWCIDGASLRLCFSWSIGDLHRRKSTFQMVSSLLDRWAQLWVLTIDQRCTNTIQSSLFKIFF